MAIESRLSRCQPAYVCIHGNEGTELHIVPNEDYVSPTALTFKNLGDSSCGDWENGTSLIRDSCVVGSKVVVSAQVVAFSGEQVALERLNVPPSKSWVLDAVAQPIAGLRHSWPVRARTVVTVVQLKRVDWPLERGMNSWWIIFRI